MLGLAALVTALSACGSADGPTSLLEISPAAPEVAPGDNVQFTATSPAAPDEPIAWAVVEPAGGTIDRGGVYTAPWDEGTYTVTASLTSLSTTQATQVRVKRNIRVDVSPTTATLAAGESLALSASATGSVKTVTWSVAQGTAGGTVTAAGVYTAPLTAGVYHVVATSTADPTKSGNSAITVTAPAPAPAPTPVSVAMSPQTASVMAGNTVQFTATVTGSTNTGVTWSVAESGGGTVSFTGLYTAPATAGVYHVLATSQADLSKTSGATVTVTAPPTSPPPATGSMGPLAAFPGAQGGGSVSVGGRGGVVYKVTNLNDSGAGSLRDCVQAQGPRTCVFTVSGTINLQSSLVITYPYITIAGQTAPGGGIQLIASARPDIYAFYIRTHDVVIRYVKIRPGAGGNSPTATESDPIHIKSNWPDVYPCTSDQSLCVAHDIVIDHVSMAWWEGKPAVYHSQYNCPGNSATVCSGVPHQAPHSISLQWNIFSEPLTSTQQTNLGLGAQIAGPADSMTDIDVHHNFFSSSSHRLPLSGLNRMRIVNNVIYNWSGFATRFAGPYDIIGNYYKPGPLTGGVAPSHEIEIFPAGVDQTTTVPTSAFISGNAGPHNGYNPSGDNWALTALVPNTYQWTETSSPASASAYGRASRLSALPSGAISISVDSATAVATDGGTFLRTVGDSQRLDCNGNWVGRRDSLDAGFIAQFVTGTGPRVSPATPTLGTGGGYPTIASGTACGDADGDGMPDSWESHWGLNPSSASGEDGANGHKIDPIWTNLEVYLSGVKGF